MSINYVYQVCAIDYWAGWTNVELKSDTSRLDYVELDYVIFNAFMETAFQIARAKGSFWQGDIRQGEIYYTGLPPTSPGDPTCDQFMVAWKQDNNGDTFIGSSIEIPGYNADLLWKSKELPSRKPSPYKPIVTNLIK